MNARTDFPAAADAQVSPARPALGRLLARWRLRLKARMRTWHRPHRVMLAAQGVAMDAAVQAFEDWAAQHEGAAVELGLSSHCLLMLADDGATASGGAQALRERAIERWTHYLDLPADGFETEWQVHTSLDLGPSPVALACAVPRAFCDGLREVAQRHGVKLLSIQPWWVGGLQQAWQALPPPSGAMDLATDSVALEQPVAAKPADASQRHWAWREGVWQTQARVAAESGRWALRSLAFVTDTVGADPADQIAAPDEVFHAPASAAVAPMSAPTSTSAWAPLLTRKARSDWAESLNFAGPRVRISFWSWALLALGAIAVVHALQLAEQVDGEHEAVQAELSRLTAHVRAPAQADKPPHEEAQAQRVSAAPIPVLSPDAHRSAAQLAAWLVHPWAEALDHADATAHRRGISLTRFQLDLGAWGTRAEQPLAWRLQAAVPDDAAALAWVEDLGPQAELQRREALAQPVPSERGTLAWRTDVSGAGRQP